MVKWAKWADDLSKTVKLFFFFFKKNPKIEFSPVHRTEIWESKRY